MPGPEKVKSFRDFTMFWPTFLYRSSNALDFIYFLSSSFWWFWWWWSPWCSTGWQSRPWCTPWPGTSYPTPVSNSSSLSAQRPSISSQSSCWTRWIQNVFRPHAISRNWWHFREVVFQAYGYIALWLTSFERPRTQTDFEDSYTFKVFLFQCINFYSSLVYIAFFKVNKYNNVRRGELIA